MKLTSIEATALKGQTFRHEFGAITMVTGRNDAGKTAIGMDAPRLLLLGYLPEHGATNPKTFALSSASKMVVAGTIEGHGQVRREWAKSGKTVKATADGVEKLPETPLVLLNAAEYFGKSDTGRVNMLFDVLKLDAKEWSIEKLAAKVQESQQADGTIEADLAAILKAKGTETVQAWLDRVADELAEAIKKAKAEVDRYTETAQGIVALAQNDTPVDPDRVEADRVEAAAKLERLTGQKGRLEAIVQQQKNTQDRRDLLERQSKELWAEFGDRARPAGTTAEALEALRAAERELTEIRTRYNQEVEAAKARAKKATRAEELRQAIAADERLADAVAVHKATLERLGNELEELGEDLTQTAQDAVNRAQQAKAAAEEKQRTVDANRQAAKERHERLTAAPCCPTCGRPGQELRAAIDEQHEATTLDLDNQQATIAKEYMVANNALTQANEVLNRALQKQRRRQAIERQMGEVRLELQKAEAAANGLEAKRNELAHIGDTSGKAPDAPAELQTLQTRVAQLQDDHRRLQIADRLEALEVEVAGLKIEGEEDADQRAAQIEDDIEAVRERLEELKGLGQKAQNQKADQKRLTEAQESRQKQEHRADRLKDAEKAVKQQRADLIKATFGPLLETVAIFTKGILGTPLEYKDGELGRYKGASWVPVRCFGGTHQAVTYAGIQAALGASAPAKIVIVDEMGRFDPENKRKFLANVAEAKAAGKIDQFVGIDVNAADYEGIEGLTLIKVG